MEKNLIYYFQKGDSPGSLNLCAINAETKLKINKYSYEILSENVLNYFKNIPEFIKNFAKAVIFKQVTDFENLSFKTSSEFIRLIISEFKKLNIQIRFIDGGTFSVTRLLIAAKINPKFDRNILFILISDDTIFVEELHRLKEGYTYPPTKATRCIKFNDGYDRIKIKEEILENIKPNKIYIGAFSNHFQNILDDMLKIFGHDKFLNCDDKNENETIVEIALQLFDKKRNWYYIIPRYSFVVKNSEYKNAYAIMWEVNEGLPFKESYMDSRKSGNYYIERYYDEQKQAEIVQIYPTLKKQCHKIKLTLTVDINLKPSLTQAAYIEQKIKSLPKILTEKMDSKIPVIGFFDNSSIICFWNEKEKCYKFSEKWNGLYGEDLYISFDKEKPKFRNEAYKVLKEKPTFVVYGNDLV
uniref:Uncharacterized protein n=1 Tax=Panagrolaimus sp. PS1159 TaxID=55785 RepID=A0AC35GFA7_9BILA